MKKIYLAIPYSGMKDLSFTLATRASAILMSTGQFNVFSPITHSHPLHMFSDLNIPGDWEFWKEVDYQYLDWADETHVLLPVDSYEKSFELIMKSTGVQAEVDYTLQQNKPVRYIKFDDYIRLIGLRTLEDAESSYYLNLL